MNRYIQSSEEKLVKRIEDLRVDITGIKTQLGNLERRVSALEPRVENLEKSDKATKVELQTLSQQVAKCALKTEISQPLSGGLHQAWKEEMLKEFKNSDIVQDLIQLAAVRRHLKPSAKFALLYSGQRDGWKANDFHQRCDGRSPTLTLFKSSKNYRFGGYTTVPWGKGYEWKADYESFVFSVDGRQLCFRPRD